MPEPETIWSDPRVVMILSALGISVVTIIALILVLTGMLWATGVTEVRPVVGEIAADTPLGRAGLPPRNLAVEVNPVGRHNEAAWRAEFAWALLGNAKKD